MILGLSSYTEYSAASMEDRYDSVERILRAVAIINIVVKKSGKRNFYLVQERWIGYSLDELAKKYCITKERVRQVVNRSTKRITHKDNIDTRNTMAIKGDSIALYKQIDKEYVAISAPESCAPIGLIKVRSWHCVICGKEKHINNKREGWRSYYIEGRGRIDSCPRHELKKYWRDLSLIIEE